MNKLCIVLIFVFAFWACSDNSSLSSFDDYYSVESSSSEKVHPKSSSEKYKDKSSSSTINQKNISSALIDENAKSSSQEKIVIQSSSSVDSSSNINLSSNVASSSSFASSPSVASSSILETSSSVESSSNINLSSNVDSSSSFASSSSVASSSILETSSSVESSSNINLSSNVVSSSSFVSSSSIELSSNIESSSVNEIMGEEKGTLVPVNEYGYAFSKECSNNDSYEGLGENSFSKSEQVDVFLRLKDVKPKKGYILKDGYGHYQLFLPEALDYCDVLAKVKMKSDGDTLYITYDFGETGFASKCRCYKDYWFDINVEYIDVNFVKFEGNIFEIIE